MPPALATARRKLVEAQAQAAEVEHQIARQDLPLASALSCILKSSHNSSSLIGR